MMTKKDLKILLTIDINNVLNQLKEIIPSESDVFDNFIIALSRHNDLLREINNGVLTPLERNIELNKIRGSILYIINSLDSLEPSNQYNDLISISKEIDKSDSKTSLGEEEEELGLFEIEDLILSSSSELQNNLKRITEETESLGEKIQEDADKLTNLNKSNPNPNRVLVKKIVSNASKTMDSYGERLIFEVPMFKEYSELSVKYSLDYITKLYESGIEIHKNEVVEFHEAIEVLIETTKESRISVTGMYEEIKNVPGLTTEFVKAKNKVIKVLDSFFEHYDNYLNNLEKLDESVKNILREIEN